MQRNVKHQFYYPHPPAAVWEFLTDSELLTQWLMENDFKPEVGHKFQFRTKPKIKLGFDGIVYCQVLELIPLKKLSYSWKGGMGEKPSLDSVVTWTLEAVEGGTNLTLEHTGFKGFKNYITYLIMNKGWLKIGKRILIRLNERAHA